jgi:hypothetical protein
MFSMLLTSFFLSLSGQRPARFYHETRAPDLKQGAAGFRMYMVGIPAKAMAIPHRPL